MIDNDLFKYVTPAVYWLLSIIWLYIFIFYFGKIKNKWKEDKMLKLLLIILAIDAFRTLFESMYFGAWYTSLAGLFNIEVYNYLAQPLIVFFPKIVNLLSALIILVLLINKWLPSELKQKKEFQNLVNQQNSELLERNKELKIAKEHAEESDRLKSAFLANMSHEIRTPMNGILGFSSLLNEPGLESDEQQAYIDIIHKSGTRMLNILSEIIEISKIESGAVDLQIKPVNINTKMASLYELLKPEAHAKSINLTLRDDLELTETILNTDEGKLYSIGTNLIKNAIKYTDEGSVEFGYNTKEIDGRNFLEFYVKDTGIGIPKDRQEVIFERFIQADIEDVEARQGAGLGLAIVKSYVEMLSGKVWVESEVGIGSTFYFRLPDNRIQKEKHFTENDVSSEKLASLANLRLSKLKILIADDDEDSLKYLKTITKSLTKEILLTSSGIECVKICQKNPDINLILMDIQMPETNGYAATQQIRQFNKEVVIVGQTAFAMESDRVKSLAAGCNDHISKPIQKDKLVELIQKHFSGN